MKAIAIRFNRPISASFPAVWFAATRSDISLRWSDVGPMLVLCLAIVGQCSKTNVLLTILFLFCQGTLSPGQE